jgi:glycosyltransferase involved in cell wall biosynthesis
MSNGYDNEKFSVSYCTIFSEGENIFLKELRRRNLDCFEVRGASFTDLPQTVWQLVGFMRREKFDIVHTQLIHGSIVGQLAARIAKVPVRVITRQYTIDCYHGSHKYLVKFDAYVAKKATKVIAISNAVRDDLIKQGVSYDNIELIYNGINLEPFNKKNNTSSLRETFPDKYLIAFVANLNQRKGHEYLLQAMAQLASHYKDIHLLLIGEGDLRKKLEELTAKLKIEKNVSFLGYQPDVPALLKDIDLYAHASVLEPLGVAILEAMAAGKCVIATTVGGVPEIITDGQTGFLVPAQDATKMADAIRNARENLSQTEKIAKAGRKHVEESFGIKSIVKKYQELYTSSILKNKVETS